MDELAQSESSSESEPEPKIPWHFWLGVGAIGIYLVFRLVQMGILGFQALF